VVTRRSRPTLPDRPSDLRRIDPDTLARVSHPPIQDVLPDRVWRIRTWVRVLAVLAGVGSLALLALLADERRRGVTDGGSWWVVAALAAVSVAVPVLGLYPKLQLRSSGLVSMRGLLGRRDVRAEDIRAVYMTEMGLRFEFTSAKPFTCIVFQATRHVRYPRFFEVLEALTGEWPNPDHPWIAAERPGEDSPESDSSPAEARQAIDDLAAFTAELAGSAAVVEKVEITAGIPGLVVEPAAGSGQMVTVIAEQWLVVCIGPGRWELDYDVESLATARALIRAVVAGTGRRTSALGRSATELDRGAGRPMVSVSYDGCLFLLVPQPAWRRWGRREDFVPYRSSLERR
jgi:hypothetical protein